MAMAVMTLMNFDTRNHGVVGGGKEEVIVSDPSQEHKGHRRGEQQLQAVGLKARSQ